MKLKLLFLLSIIFSSFAQENSPPSKEELIIEEELSLEKQLWEGNEMILKDMMDLNQKRLYLKSHPNPPPEVIINHKRTKPFLATIRRKAILQKVNSKDRSPLTLTRPIDVWAVYEFEGSPFSILLKKEGEKFIPKYKTLSTNLISLSEELELYPQFDAKKIYHPHKEELSYYNSTWDFDFDIMYHIDFLNSYYFQEIYYEDNSQMSATTIDFRLYYRSKLPIHLGLLFGGQSGDYVLSSPNDSFHWDNFYIGGLLRWDLLEGDVFNLNIQAGLDHLWRFRGLSLEQEYIFSGLSWQANMEAVFKTFIGNYLFALGYKSSSLSVKETSNSFYKINSDTPRTLEGLHFSVGLRLGFSL